MESRAYYALGNGVRARAALTSAKTTANAVYIEPAVQAALDLQSGILHADEEDFKTAYSYFYEAFEGYDSVKCQAEKATLALKYMLLCKIMLNLPEDVSSIVTGKLALQYAGSDVTAMKAVATASKNSSLQEFEAALAAYPAELQGDATTRAHLGRLYDSLLEKNLARIVMPYSKIEIARVAELIQLDATVVEQKLSTMILDKTLHGILDQGSGCLELFEPAPQAALYQSALDAIGHMGHVVEALYAKSKMLF